MKNNGFSLVELIVILAIVSILLGITHLHFSEMAQRENIKADLKKITGIIRETQVTCQTQGRTAILVMGDNAVTSSMYLQEALTSPPVVSLTGIGMPNMPVPDDLPIAPGDPVPAPPLITSTVNLKSQTQDYTTIYVDRRGLVYSIDEDTKEPTYDPIAVCFSGNAVVINGNQLTTGILAAGKACKPSEVMPK